MSNDTEENTDTHETSVGGFFGGKTDILLFGGGLLFLLISIAVFFGADTRPNAWLHYIDIRFWPVSVYASIILWIAVVWLVSEWINSTESAEIIENYLPFIRMLAVVGVLLVIIFALRSLNIAAPIPGGHPAWFDLVVVVSVCCVVRSLFLLYDYRYGEDEIDLEEAKWFWGFSGFILVAVIVLGCMCISPAPTKMQTFGTPVSTGSLFTSCTFELQEMLRTGDGSFALKTFALLLFVAPIAFVYVVGKWILAVYVRIRGEQ